MQDATGARLTVWVFAGSISPFVAMKVCRMRRKLVAGNWKMYGALTQNETLLNAVASGMAQMQGVDCAVCVPFPYLAQAQHLLPGQEPLITRCVAILAHPLLLLTEHGVGRSYNQMILMTGHAGRDSALFEGLAMCTFVE